MLDTMDYYKEVKFMKLQPNAILPEYNHADDACMDLFTPVDIHIGPGETVIAFTDIAIELPKGFEGRIRGRSGYASKGVVAHHGTIDFPYRGNLGVILHNNNGISVDISAGKAIGQFSIAPVWKIMRTEVDHLTDTDRGTNGFGSSGM